MTRRRTSLWLGNSYQWLLVPLIFACSLGAENNPGPQGPCIPINTVPADGAMIDNGGIPKRDDHDIFRVLDTINWEFDWEGCYPVDRYHLYVKGANATIPIINNDSITESKFSFTSSGYIIERHRYDWTWKVRAMVDSVWLPWSDPTSFDVEPATEYYSTLLFSDPDVMRCEQYGAIHLDDIEINNNIWNYEYLSEDFFEQCIYLLQDTDTVLFGWKWEYPQNLDRIMAFPSIKYGWNPWSYSSSNWILPKQLSEINHSYVNYDILPDVNDGTFSATMNVYFSSNPVVSFETTKHEIKVWEYHQGDGMLYWGQDQGLVTIGGTDYRHFLEEGGNWSISFLLKQEGTLRGTIDVSEIIDHFVARGLLDSTDFLSAIDFGTELGNSRGKCVIRQFDVQLD